MKTIADVDLYVIRDMANYLGITEWDARYYIRIGSLPGPSHLVGKRRYYLKHELEEMANVLMKGAR